jgi:hypothetical protein
MGPKQPRGGRREGGTRKREGRAKGGEKSTWWKVHNKEKGKQGEGRQIFMSMLHGVCEGSVCCELRLAVTRPGRGI